MTSLYNCRHAGDEYRISKFDSHFDLESSYLCTEAECECPAGHRPTCRHRAMLPKFIQREHVGDEWFFDYDRGGWVQGAMAIDTFASEASRSEAEPQNITATEIDQRMAELTGPNSPIVEHLVNETFDAINRLAPQAPTTPAQINLIDEDEVEIIEPSAIMGNGLPHLAGVYAKDITPSPQPSPKGMIRRRV